LHGPLKRDSKPIVRGEGVKGGVRYMQAVIAKYPQSEFAARAKRLVAEVHAAQAEE